MSREFPSSIVIPHPVEVLHAHGTAMACDLSGQMQAQQLHGLFAGDTRVLSTYQIRLFGHPWRLLSRLRTGHASARWEFQNPVVRDPLSDIPEGTLLFNLRRRLAGALHDDLEVLSFAGKPVRIRIAIQLDADFADIFEVKERRFRPRLNVRRIPTRSGVLLLYDRGAFRRALNVSFATKDPAATEMVAMGSSFIFDLTLKHEERWACCLEAVPEVGSERWGGNGDFHGEFEKELSSEAAGGLIGSSGVSVQADPLLKMPFERGQRDLHELAIWQRTGDPKRQEAPYVAAGVPWFLTLFGRDSLMAAIMAGVDGAWLARGALSALGALQARSRDDWRDAEPGKLPHETRMGELAWEESIPHLAYYGAHDVPALYCLALWSAWRWTGDRELLRTHLETARKALDWCERSGDRDGDGLLEYGTRSRKGYRNQGWKDAEDAIVHVNGRLAELPLATVELQGNLFAAYLAMAEIAAELGDEPRARELREKARQLRARVEERFWMEDAGFYALALDGKKDRVASISSNPTHLLWCGLPGRERAERVAARVSAADMFSGWGMRTISSRNPAYNPLSYQLGSVWPHDTAIAAAGMIRYGLFDVADALIRSVLEAAGMFESARLPELFCGLDRSYGLPVPYEKANIPQAWAAATPLLLTQALLGLVPDAPRKRCFISPRLPEWLPELVIQDLSVGKGRVRLKIVRRGRDTIVEKLDSDGISVLFEEPEAPLWGRPPLL